MPQIIISSAPQSPFHHNTYPALMTAVNLFHNHCQVSLTEGVAHRQTENISGLCCAERKKKNNQCELLISPRYQFAYSHHECYVEGKGRQETDGMERWGKIKGWRLLPGGEKNARWKRRRMQEWALARSLDQMKERAKEASVREEASTYRRFPTDVRRVTGKFQQALLHREWHLPTKPHITNARKKKHLTRR